ncbi:DNA mismatch repair protein Msh6 [Gonapodya prolifera JEL478]|uniref:DNA mismatch repair protein n=1 Tax=Gonapodya prolifera (strain JEL478) TaxID=1344416 RepID=A0A139A667_GONPJ|nr:DNA mismatch repair protein Msh6 [Gonapodya prolifera JEL478]|eukprot:KXS11873.1 DNA mismatch repair protein Msh6 [Gonapodya prolifera JEL478]
MAPTGKQLTPEQISRMEENKRKAQEKLKAAQKPASSPLVQKSITSFFTPGSRSSTPLASSSTIGSQSPITPLNTSPLVPSSGNFRQRALDSLDVDSDDDVVMSLVDEGVPVAAPSASGHSGTMSPMEEDEEPGTRSKKRSKVAEEDEEETTSRENSKSIGKRRRLVRQSEVKSGDTEGDNVEQVENDDTDENVPDKGSDYEGGDGSDSESIEDFIVSDDDEEALYSSQKRSKSTSSKRGKSSSASNRGASKIVAVDSITTNVRKGSGSSVDEFRIGSPSTSRAGATDVQKRGDGDRVQRFVSPVTKTKQSGIENPIAVEKSSSNYDFLSEDRICDADGRRPSDPDYDPRTVFVPPHLFSSKNGFTEFEKQYWEIKSKFFDTVTFFKKGKFYELYDKDADIAHQQFDLRLAKTDRAHMRMAGVPEAVVDDWIAQFLAKGYKVAKVDQVETMVGKRIASKNGQGPKSKADSIIKRELTQVLTSGTLTDPTLLTSDMATYCMSIKEFVQDDENCPTFGVVFVDCATAQFNLAHFSDDVTRSTLETLLTQVQPKEIIFEKGCVSSRTSRLVKNSCPGAGWIGLTSEAEFWDSDRALLEIETGNYFQVRAADFVTPLECEHDLSWPPALSASKDKIELLSAFGGLLHHLRTLKLDRELISQGKFSLYDPMRRAGTLLLDGQTLKNLEILQNKDDASSRGTLLERIQNCSTPFGKRLLRRWLCHPLRNIADIEARLDCVDDLSKVPGLVETIDAKLRKLPDMERLLSRVHSGSCRPKEFVSLLKGMQLTLNVFDDVQPHLELLSASRLIALCKESIPVDLAELLDSCAKSFDVAKAEAENIIKPSTEADEVYAGCESEVGKAEKKLRDYLREVRSDVKCNTINFRDMGKDRYLFELPRKFSSIPHSWELRSQTKDVHRYYTAGLRRLVEELEEAEEMLKEAEKGAKARLYIKFDESNSKWSKAVNAVAELDCLFSLFKTKSVFGEPVCRPSFVDSMESVVEFEDLRHPCLTVAPGESLIPNDTVLGGDNARMILLTGPNMGGKSTLLRQVCVGVILAQMGCYVPAKSCRLKPVDRIFTRIGANDNILAGHSTFFVELSETSKILKEATQDSLVILDELGRGTSTHDGYAVAYSVLHHLVASIGCLGLFTTHHAMLTEEYKDNPLVSRCFMSFQNDDEKREVTFLYKLAQGVSRKSYGMNVAAMAGVPREVVDKAEAIAQEFETQQGLQRARARAVDTNLPVAVQADFAFLLENINSHGPLSTDGLLKELVLRWKGLKHAV